MRLNINRKELYSAGLMMLIGIGTTVGSLDYDVRSLARMGPGYFPLMLGVGLMIIAALILVTPSDDADMVTEDDNRPQFRGWACVIIGVVLFIVLGKYGGLVPATFALVMVSALGDDGNSVIASAVLGLAITAMAVGIFHFGLQMQFPLFTWG